MSSVVLSCAIIGLHGAMRVPDDLFLDDTDVSAGQVDPPERLARDRWTCLCMLVRAIDRKGGRISVSVLTFWRVACVPNW
jgi:hypothetical protein